MSANNPDGPPGQGSDSSRANGADTPRPLKAIRQEYLDRCNRSAHEVMHCPAKSCPLWPFRFGRNLTAEMLAAIANIKIYPLERNITWAEFFENGGTRLDAIELYCLDCSGYCKSEVRNCKFASCHLHPFRLGRNPNRALSPEQAKAAAARLKDNIEKGKRKKSS